MLKYYVFLRNFLADPLPRNDRGATAVEYGLIVALIAAAITAILVTLGGTIRTGSPLSTTISDPDGGRAPPAGIRPLARPALT